MSGKDGEIVSVTLYKSKGVRCKILTYRIEGKKHSTIVPFDSPFAEVGMCVTQQDANDEYRRLVDIFVSRHSICGGEVWSGCLRKYRLL